MDSWLVHQGIYLSTAKDTECRGDRCTLNMMTLKRPPTGVVRKLGNGVAAQVFPSHWTMDQNYKIRR
ncbi:hypothetical protein TNCV_1709871 [Trichonephila clavipes]|nr:hypothetical protein TNCV_1709871 [Trichonephila clavipes]